MADDCKGPSQNTTRETASLARPNVSASTGQRNAPTHAVSATTRTPPSTVTPMRFATWNIKGNNGIGRARRRDIVSALDATSPDVIVLQEVAWKGDLHADMMHRLKACGWHAAAYSGIVGSTTKRYGNLIASQFPLEYDNTDWAPGVPWRQSLLRVTVDGPDGEFVVIGAHVPNGSGNGWRKIETFEALARSFDTNTPTPPTIVAGDFNEPQAVLADGTVIPFTMTKRSDGQWSSDGQKKGKCGRTFPKQRWVDGVRSILGRYPSVDLTHAARVTGGASAWHVTHQVQGKDRFFDHILVSSHWTVLETGFDHEVRINGTSDHSLVWADVRLNR